MDQDDGDAVWKIGSCCGDQPGTSCGNCGFDGLLLEWLRFLGLQCQVDFNWSRRILPPCTDFLLRSPHISAFPFKKKGSLSLESLKLIIVNSSLSPLLSSFPCVQKALFCPLNFFTLILMTTLVSCRDCSLCRSSENDYGAGGMFCHARTTYIPPSLSLNYIPFLYVEMGAFSLLVWDAFRKCFRIVGPITVEFTLEEMDPVWGGKI